MRQDVDKITKLQELLRATKKEIYFVFMPIAAITEPSYLELGFGGVRKNGTRARIDQPKLVGRTLFDIAKAVIEGIPVSIQQNTDIVRMHNIMQRYVNLFGSVTRIANMPKEDTELLKVLEEFSEILYGVQYTRIESKFVEKFRRVNSMFKRTTINSAKRVKDISKKKRKEVKVL